MIISSGKHGPRSGKSLILEILLDFEHFSFIRFCLAKYAIVWSGRRGRPANSAARRTDPKRLRYTSTEGRERHSLTRVFETKPSRSCSCRSTSSSPSFVHRFPSESLAPIFGRIYPMRLHASVRLPKCVGKCAGRGGQPVFPNYAKIYLSVLLKHSTKGFQQRALLGLPCVSVPTWLSVFSRTGVR